MSLNPFDAADASSLYALDSEELERRKRLGLMLDEEVAERMWCCGRCRRPKTYVLVLGGTAIGLLVLGLALGLGLGLGLKSRGDAVDVDAADFGPPYTTDTTWGGHLAHGGSVYDGDAAEVTLSEDELDNLRSMTEATPHALALGAESGATVRVVDARPSASLHRLNLASAAPSDRVRTPAITNSAKSRARLAHSTETRATTAYELDDCPIEALVREAETVNPDFPFDNVTTHVTWTNLQCLEAMASNKLFPYIGPAGFLTAYPPFTAGMSHTSSGAYSSVAILLTWPGPPDTFVEWRGNRHNSALAARSTSESKYAICTRTSVTANVSAVPDADLFFQLRSLYNYTWYRDEVDAEMQDDSADPLDTLVGLSSTFSGALTDSAACVELTSGASDAYAHLWTVPGALTYVDFTLHNDSATITARDVTLENFFTLVVTVCRCPSGDMHRFMGVDTLTLAFAEYHECVLQTVGYHIRADAASAGDYGLARVYSTPVVFFALGPRTSPLVMNVSDSYDYDTRVENADAANRMCASVGGMADIVQCAFKNGVRWDKATEGMSLESLRCPSFA